MKRMRVTVWICYTVPSRELRDNPYFAISAVLRCV